jgi:hypothetical protein
VRNCALGHFLQDATGWFLWTSACAQSASPVGLPAVAMSTVDALWEVCCRQLTPAALLCVRLEEIVKVPLVLLAQEELPGRTTLPCSYGTSSPIPVQVPSTF